MSSFDLTTLYKNAKTMTEVTQDEETSAFSALLTTSGTTYFQNKADNQTVHGAYLVMCVASAGQQTAKMKGVYEAYNEKCDDYKEVCSLAQWAAGRYQAAVDAEGSVGYGTWQVDSADYNLATLEGIREWSGALSTDQANIKSTLDAYDVERPSGSKLDEDQWQSVRDGLDYAKSIQSTDMKTLAAQFDQASKDCNSSQQLATDGIKDLGDLLSSVGKSI